VTVDANEGPPGAVVAVIGYGRDWNGLAGAPLDPVTERTARRRHQDGKLYAAVLEGPDHALASVIVHPGGGRVRFWDGTRTIERAAHFYSDGPEPADGGERTWRLTRLDRTNAAAHGHSMDAEALERRALAVTDSFTVEDGATVLQWVRFDEQSPTGRVVERRPIDDHAERLTVARPEFGAYAHVFVADLLDQLWPGLEPLPWSGP
jgi:hypothetical protein